MGMMNSPFDYNSEDCSRRSSDASSLYGPAGLPGLTLQDQRRLQMKYDQAINRQNGWDDRMVPSPSPVPPPMGTYRRVSGAASLPPRTPLPHEVPGNENRRASDPVKLGYNHNVDLPRYNSLNSVAPLPLPDNMRSLQPARNMETVVEGTVYQGGYHNNMDRGNPGGSWGNVPGSSQPNGSGYHGNMPPGNDRGPGGQGGADDLVLPDEMVQYLEDQRQRTVQQSDPNAPHMMPYPAERMMNPGYQNTMSPQYQGRQFQNRHNHPSGVNVQNGNPAMTGGGGVMPGGFNGGMHKQMGPGNGQYDPQQQMHMIPPSNNQNTLRVPSQPMPMEMSPDCNQVTSTVNNDTDGIDAMARGLANLSEDGMDHVQPLVPESVNNVGEMTGNGRCPPDMSDVNSNVSNMVVNDMSSMLTSLAEENKYLNML